MAKAEAPPFIKVLITLDSKGQLLLASSGPIKGKAGLVALLEEAVTLARKAQE